MRLSDFVQINPRVGLRKGDEYPCVMMDEITLGRRYVMAENMRIYKGGAVFQSGDTLFARITPCLENGKIAQFVARDDEVGFGSTEFFVFRHRDGLSDPGYVYYLALSDIVRKPAEKSMFGASGRQRADLNVVKETEVPTPPLPTQRRIASILSAYDDLIENNTRRIKILEEMARLIYREWFVHFRFPGHEGVKMKKGMPEGWEVKPIGEVIETLGGGTPSTKEPAYWEGGNIQWYSPTDLTSSGSMFISDSAKKITKLGLQKSSARMFPPYSVMMTSRATIGVVAINTNPASTNQGFITCVPSDRLSMYQIYFWILENKEKIINLSSGATFKEMTRSTFRKLPIVVADGKTNGLFTETVQPICKQIETLQAKNANLRKTRDLLLPKLVSGEVEV